MRILIGDRPSGDDGWASSSGPDAYRLISYADLAVSVAPPADRYEFYGLADSWPARVRLAAQIEARLRKEGAEVLNPPSALAAADSPAALARLLTPSVRVEPAIGGKGDLPCRLRAAHGGIWQELDWLETEREVDEVVLDWILSGTDPSVILRLSTPSCPRRFFKGIRMADRLQVSGDLDDAVRIDLISQLDRTQRQVVAFEYWMEAGRPLLWRIDDSLRAVASVLIPTVDGAGPLSIPSPS